MKTILIVFGLCFWLEVNGLHDYPGAIEISGYGDRRGRSGKFDQVEDLQRIQTVSAPSAASRRRTKTQADIETVRQNIEKYNKLFKLDTRTLPEQQKQLLDKIVERVARLKEKFDIEDGKTSPSATLKDGIDTTLPLQQQQQTTVSQATATDATTISDIDINQETSSLADAIVDDFYSGTSTIINLSPSSSSSSSTSIAAADDDQIVAARANNNNNLSSSSTTTSHKKTTASVSSSSSSLSSSTSSKSTRKPSSTKRHNQRPSSTSSSSPLSTNQQRLPTTPSPPPAAAAAAAAAPSTADDNNNDQFDQFNIQQRNPLGNNVAAASDPLYDSNVTTSAIIDSLSNTNGREDYYSSKLSNNKDKKPGTAKPTKYHYYPHNQHIYLLPECAIQQVCNAVYVRLNYTQPLCACPSRYRDPCSASLNEDDQHTTKLVGDSKKKAITLAKTCEATTEMRECRTPKDWSLLALQNTRTGKSHYLVICKCPEHYKMEGPMAHDQPTYASVPGIRVFGMMCVKPGYPIRKPSYQPPKRYQLQKPLYHASPSNKYGVTKDPSLVVSRPTYNRLPSTNYGQHHQQQDTFQNQHQANYQYLNRPDHSSTNNKYHHTHSDTNSFNSFGSGAVYGRTKGQTEIDAAEEGETTVFNTEPTTLPPQTTISSVTREKRSLSPFDDPPFPWDRLYEFEKTINWD